MALLGDVECRQASPQPEHDDIQKDLFQPNMSAKHGWYCERGIRTIIRRHINYVRLKADPQLNTPCRVPARWTSSLHNFPQRSRIVL
jgi:hypothetical protein